MTCITASYNTIPNFRRISPVTAEENLQQASVAVLLKNQLPIVIIIQIIVIHLKSNFIANKEDISLMLAKLRYILFLIYSRRLASRQATCKEVVIVVLTFAILETPAKSEQLPLRCQQKNISKKAIDQDDQDVCMRLRLK